VQQQCPDTELSVEISGTPVPLSASFTRGLVLACREAVENATRHGRARHVAIDCRFNESEVRMDIADDGCGFDVEGARNAPGGHFGLSGMRQRIERLGGNMDVSSTPGTGTRISIRLPHPFSGTPPEMQMGQDRMPQAPPATEI
jgi:signal transduction histidine kinase